MSFSASKCASFDRNHIQVGINRPAPETEIAYEDHAVGLHVGSKLGPAAGQTVEIRPIFLHIYVYMQKKMDLSYNEEIGHPDLQNNTESLTILNPADNI